MRRRPFVLTVLTPALAIGLALSACGGDDSGENTDDGATTTEAPAADATDAPSGASGEVTISGVLKMDAGAPDSTMCVYIDDATLGQVFISPTGGFDGLFRAITDGSDPEYLVELVSGEDVLIAKGTNVVATGVTDGPEMRCTQGDQTEISATSLAAG